jgi:signal transduction histidine kinase
MTVSDNGRGFVVQDTSEGNGLKNMDTRAKAMNAKFKVTSGADNGTRIELDVPIT